MFDKNDAKIEQERAEAEEKRQRTPSSFSASPSLVLSVL